MILKNINLKTIRLRRAPTKKKSAVVLGITGGIACGKSLISQYFKELGAVVLSADELAREVVKPGQKTYAKIVAHFGPDILSEDGTIDRSLLATKIFLYPDERERLNKIIHPAIGKLADLRLSALRQRSEIPLIIYESPLLFEVHAEDRVDLVLVVTTTPELQLARLMQRDNLSRGEALLRISTQMPLAEKISRADILVENNDTPEKTRRLIDDIFRRLVGLKKKLP
jgi:dephospho-CoA kinase